MKKNNKNKFKKTAIAIITVVLFVTIVVLLILGLKSYIDNSSYFKIKKVILNGLDDKKVAQDISKRFLYDNIFNLDLQKIKENLKISNPQFHDVEVIRSFPGQLTINVVVRKPVAQIKQREYFLVDNEGVIVSDKSKSPFEGAVIISGLKSISDLSFGVKINLDNLRSGISLAKELKDINKVLISSIPNLATNKIEIDVSKHPSIFVSYQDLELRFYSDNLAMGLRSLNKMLPSLKSKIEQVEYIDLRFAEPAVSFKK